MSSKLVMRAIDLSDSANLPFTKIYVQDSIKDIRKIITVNSALLPFSAPSYTAKEVKKDMRVRLESTLDAQPNTIFLVDRLGFDKEAGKVTIIIDWWGVRNSAGQLLWFPNDQLKRSFEAYFVDHPLLADQRLQLSEFIKNRFFKGESIYEENIKSKLPSKE